MLELFFIFGFALVLGAWLQKKHIDRMFWVVELKRYPAKLDLEKPLQTMLSDPEQNEAEVDLTNVDPSDEREYDLQISREMFRNPPSWATPMETRAGVAVSRWRDFETFDRAMMQEQKIKTMENRIDEKESKYINKGLERL